VKKLRAVDESDLLVLSWLPDKVAHELFACLHSPAARP
jgi:hypothetical protein